MPKIDGRVAIPIDVAIRNHYWIKILVHDTLDGKVDITRQFRIESKRSLPRLWHTQIVAQDSSAARDSGRTLCTNLLEHISLTGGKGRNSTLGLRCDIRCLSHTRVAHCWYQPYKWQTTYEKTCTSTKDKILIARNVPVESHTRREWNAGIRHIISTEVLSAKIVRIVFW